MRTTQDYAYLLKSVEANQRAFHIPRETVDYVLKMYSNDNWIEYCLKKHRSYGVWLLDVLDRIDLAPKSV